MGESATNDDPKFEDLLQELEGIVGKLESGELSLEDSLGSFERGMSVSRQADRILASAEKRIEQLVRSGDGDVATPWSPDVG